MQPEVFNSRHERLSVLTEGSGKDLTVVLVHGFGTGKDENARLFIDISQRLSSVARVVRFDFSGYGESEGKQEDVDLNKMSDDLASVLTWVRQRYGGRLIIIAHSMGTLAARSLSPEGIEKIIFTGVTPPDASAHITSTQQRLQSRAGGVLNEDSISLYPRKDGTIQRIGSSYWKVLRGVRPLELMEALAQKTRLIIIKPKQDEIVGGSDITAAYCSLPGVTYLELDGDHNFTAPQDRQRLLETLAGLIE
jgi:pimeloyl-ACP methyl ester carboxylesterase